MNDFRSSKYKKMKKGSMDKAKIGYRRNMQIHRNFMGKNNSKTVEPLC